MAELTEEDYSTEVTDSSDCAVIIDLGSGFIKAGLQTDPEPTAIIPSLVGRPRRRYMEHFEGRPAFIGEEAIVQRHQLSFSYPIDHGHVDDWLEMEELWNHTFHRALNVKPADHPLLVTEPPLCSSKHREKVAEVMFEMYDVPELTMAIQGVMALYATGRTSGLVIEIGEGVTQIVPVYEGFTDKGAIRRSDFGGQELTMYMQKMLCDAGYPMTSRDDYEHVRIIKETLCYVALDPGEEDQRQDLQVTYTLPEGMTLRDGVTTEVKLGPERFYCPEALFDPRIIHRDNASITELLWQAIQSSAIETRKAMMNAVILSGGSSQFPGLQERLEQELKCSAPPQARSDVRVLAASDRLFGVWLGARLFCQPSMRNMQNDLWITRSEWQEIGMSVVHKKVAFKAT